ncbi:hypothetical protein MRX96_038040 [Rhipicephalus microplus]
MRRKAFLSLPPGDASLVLEPLPPMRNDQLLLKGSSLSEGRGLTQRSLPLEKAQLRGIIATDGVARRRTAVQVAVPLHAHLLAPRRHCVSGSGLGSHRMAADADEPALTPSGRVRV